MRYIVILSSMSIFLFFCKTGVDKTGKAYTSAYICPMHCEGSGSDQPGTCPVCGMDYVANAAEKHDHQHDQAFACPMHPEVTGQAGDSCTRCGMSLQAVESGTPDRPTH